MNKSTFLALIAYLLFSFAFLKISHASTIDVTETTITTVNHMAERYRQIAATFSTAPIEWANLREELAVSVLSGDGVRALTYILLLLLIGAGVEAFYWTHSYASMRVILNLSPSSPRMAFIFALRRLWLSCFGLALFAVAALGSASAFAWPAGVYNFVATLTWAIVTFRLLMILANAVLSPSKPELRLVPSSDKTTRVLMMLSTTLAMLGTFAWFAPPLFQQVGAAAQLSEAVRLTVGTLIAFLLLIASIRFLRLRSARLTEERRLGIVPRFPQALGAATAVVVVYALWLNGSSVPALLVATAALTIALQIPLRRAVFYFWRDKSVSKIDNFADAAETGNLDRGDPALAPSVILPAVRLTVVLIGLVICAIAIDIPISRLATSDSPLARLALRLLGVAALALFANVAWIAVKTTIDYQLETLGTADHGHLGSGARLLTLLPILRMTAAIVLLVLLVLSSLWTLGLEITPLLAGAGVVGLAFGFGAQSLVKDVITGVFYLAEDTFRVGEYIESGSSTKGTVERLTLRTVALRHHNGPLHFVPYGTLGTIRNTSRDWVIEKFNLPLPIDVDSEKVRKLIKKVGEEMLDDEEIGPLILQPLKGKLYRVDPGVKIFRCNFRTAPGNQFDVRAAAYKRIEAALTSAGISYAGTLPALKTPDMPPTT